MAAMTALLEVKEDRAEFMSQGSSLLNQEKIAALGSQKLPILHRYH